MKKFGVLFALSLFPYILSANEDIAGMTFELEFEFRSTSNRAQRETAWEQIKKKADAEVASGRLNQVKWNSAYETVRYRVLSAEDTLSSGTQNLFIGKETWSVKTVYQDGRSVIHAYDGRNTIVSEGKAIEVLPGLNLSSAPAIPLIGINLPGAVIYRNEKQNSGIIRTGFRKGDHWPITYYPAKLAFSLGGGIQVARPGGVFNGLDINTEYKTSGVFAFRGINIAQNSEFIVRSETGDKSFAFKLIRASESNDTEVTVEKFLKKGAMVTIGKGPAVIYDPQDGPLYQQVAKNSKPVLNSDSKVDCCTAETEQEKASGPMIPIGIGLAIFGTALIVRRAFHVGLS